MNVNALYVCERNRYTLIGYKEKSKSIILLKPLKVTREMLYATNRMIVVRLSC